MTAASPPIRSWTKGEKKLKDKRKLLLPKNCNCSLFSRQQLLKVYELTHYEVMSHGDEMRAYTIYQIPNYCQMKMLQECKSMHTSRQHRGKSIKSFLEPISTLIIKKE